MCLKTYQPACVLRPTHHPPKAFLRLPSACGSRRVCFWSCWVEQHHGNRTPDEENHTTQQRTAPSHVHGETTNTNASACPQWTHLKTRFSDNFWARSGSETEIEPETSRLQIHPHKNMCPQEASAVCCTMSHNTYKNRRLKFAMVQSPRFAVEKYHTTAQEQSPNNMFQNNCRHNDDDNVSTKKKGWRTSGWQKKLHDHSFFFS